MNVGRRSVMRRTNETGGPGESVHARKLTLLCEIVARGVHLEADLKALRGHLERRAAGGPVGVRVMACLLDLAVMQEKLCQLEIVALGELAE